MNAKKIGSLKCVLKKRFKREVRELRQECESEGLCLLSYTDAEWDDVCILSENEYELGCAKSQCSGDIESYFLSQEEYDAYMRDRVS